MIQHSPSTAIESWVLQKPCQVGLLADALVEGLSRSRVALPIMTAFGEERSQEILNSCTDSVAFTTSFRDALLRRHPVILDVFLEKAVDVGDTEVSFLFLQTTIC